MALAATRKSFPGLSFMIVTKRYNIRLFIAMYLIIFVDNGLCLHVKNNLITKSMIF